MKIFAGFLYLVGFILCLFPFWQLGYNNRGPVLVACAALLTLLICGPRWIRKIAIRLFVAVPPIIIPPIALFLHAALRRPVIADYAGLRINLTPTWLNVALILGVSINAVLSCLSWPILTKNRPFQWLHPRAKMAIGPITLMSSILFGFAIGVSAFYIVIAPVPFPLFPLLSLLGTLLLRLVLIGGQTIREKFFTRPVVAGIVCSLFLLVVAEIPRTVTRYFLLAPHSKTEPLDVTLLRYLGDWETLIQSAGGAEWIPQYPDFLAFTEARIFGERSWRFSDDVLPVAQEAIPLLSGDTLEAAFAEFARSQRYFESEQEDVLRGTREVGDKIPNLTLSKSALRGSVSADAALAYLEWEMTFENLTQRSQEARAEVILPPGGVVSRATLWINGIEQEAAITASGKAQAAYENVVSVRRDTLRDPLLVTEISPGSVFIQCFPIPGVGEAPRNRMKIKLGITAPLQLASFTQGSLPLPSIRKGNFSYSGSSTHRIELSSNMMMSSEGGIAREVENHSQQALSRTLPESAEGYRLEFPSSNPGEARVISVSKQKSDVVSWSLAPGFRDKRIITQSLKRKSVAPPKSLIFVVDGSEAMKEKLALVDGVIDGISPSTYLSVYFSGEQVREVIPMQSIPTERTKDKIKGLLRRFAFLGATDNGAGLLEALREIDKGEKKPSVKEAATRNNPLIIWIHAPQPHHFWSYELVREYLSRRGDSVPIISIQTEPGRDMGAEGVFGNAPLPGLQRFEHPLTSSAAILPIRCRLLGTAECIERDFSLNPSSRIPAIPEYTQPHLAHLWGSAEVRRLVAQDDYTAASELATKLGLVTPVSSAIVLETREDYEQNGIAPPKDAPEGRVTIPTTPEPDDLALIVMVVAITGFVVSQHRRCEGLRHG